MSAIRSKARSYALFGGRHIATGDLLHDALLAAFEGRPVWRSNQSLVDYCDAFMARKVGFVGAQKTRRERP
jgi:hypothetical protein